MARLKDENWSLSDPPKTDNHVIIALLMDLRDELKKLNALLHCSNFVSIPKKLEAIRRNTTKKRGKNK